MTTIATTPDVETYANDDTDDFRIIVSAAPEKIYRLHIGHSRHPFACADTRAALLSAALRALARRTKPSVSQTKIMLALCKHDLLCEASVGCDLLNGEDLVPTALGIYDSAFNTWVTLAALADMVAKGAFTDAKPTVVAEVAV